MALHKHDSPETFTSTTPLPKKVSGPVYHPDQAPTASDTREFGVFHGDTPMKNVKVTDSGKGEPVSGSGKVGGLPEGVDQFAPKVK
jgi:hypothetical protein